MPNFDSPSVRQGGLDLLGVDWGRQIAYYDPNYLKSLLMAFSDNLTEEDLLALLNTAWQPVGSGEFSSITQDFAVRNMTNNFKAYWIQVSRISWIEAGPSTNSSVNIYVSDDNGETIITGGNPYSRARQRRIIGGAFPGTIYTYATADATIGTDMLLAKGTTSTAWLDLFVFNPFNPDLYTSFFWEASSNFGSRAYVEGTGSYNVAETINAIVLRVTSGSGATFTGGLINVYALPNT